MTAATAHSELLDRVLVGDLRALVAQAGARPSFIAFGLVLYHEDPEVMLTRAKRPQKHLIEIVLREKERERP